MKFIFVISDRALGQAAERFAAISQEAPVVLAEILNTEGVIARAKTVAAETGQTGLAESTIDRAQHAIDAGAGKLEFWIQSSGGNVRLKYFGAKEGDGGVTASPWGRATFYPGAFITSGRPAARRMVKKLNGQVYERATGESRWNETRPTRKKKYKSSIRVVRSGLFIPDEMTKGETIKVFEGQTLAMAERIVTRLGGLL